MGFLFIFKQSIVPLFFILTVAIIYERKFHPDMSGMNAVALQLLCPILIFKKVTDSGYTFIDLSHMMLYMLLFTAIMAAIGIIFSRLAKMHENQAVSFISNASLMNFGNMGIPLVLFSFGDAVAVDALLVWIVFNIPLSTYGVWLADSDRRIKKAAANIIKIPMFPAFVFAIILNEFGLTVPDAIGQPMDFLGVATIPIMTLIYGFQLAHVKYKHGLLAILFACVMVRLIVSPIVGYILVKLLNMPTQTAQVAMVMVSTPMASSPILYAMVFKRDHELTTTIVLVTTVVSAFTLPIVIMLAKSYL